MSILLTLFRVVPLRGWLIIAAVIAGVTGALYLRQHFINQGAQRAVTKIETQDRSAVDAAEHARSKRGECTGPGSDPRNRWDQSAGVCVRDAR